ncbi:Uncharacterised protein [Halioglobus japonicus]|nr:Uncharacterised protein [Halioglobus japonicus]
MAIIRFILGRLILLFNWAFPPKSVKRDLTQQAQIDLQTNNLTLYQYAACPFCVKVRRAMKRQALKIDTKDVKRIPDAREELMAGGGQLKVPCLRIEQEDGQPQWMYESNEIINYLAERFPTASHA